MSCFCTHCQDTVWREDEESRRKPQESLLPRTLHMCKASCQRCQRTMKLVIPFRKWWQHYMVCFPLLTMFPPLKFLHVLGPVQKAMLQVEGVPVETLADTRVLSSTWSSSSLHWRRTKSPSRVQQSGGQGWRNVWNTTPLHKLAKLWRWCRQIRVSMSRDGGRRIEAVLQDQSNASVNLLLGTDSKSQLGLVLKAVQYKK